MGRSDASEGALGKSVVLDLLYRIDGMHHHLYFDNFFTFVPLLEMLLQKGTYACGTTRQSYREFPSSLKIKGRANLRWNAMVFTKGTVNYICIVHEKKKKK